MGKLRRHWTPNMIDRLFELRDVQKLSWDEIGAQFNDKGANCCTRYNYYSTKRRIAAARSRFKAPSGSDYVAFPARAIASPPSPPPAPPRRIAIAPALAPAEPVQRPRYFHDADADIRARIAAQGLTAGFFGDPAPGRSALDQRGGRL